MRITQSMITRSTINRLSAGKEKLVGYQNRISTQKKIEKPSDDALGYSRITSFNTAFEQNEQFLKNIRDAESWTGTTSLALDQLHEYVIEAVSYASQGADGQADTELRQSLADSVRGILEESVALGNSQYLGRSVFSGTNTSNSTPFELTGDTVSYSGNDANISRKISSTMTVDINITGQEIMDTQIFSGLDDLLVALESDDTVAIQTAMESLKESEDKILGISTRIGSMSNNLSLVENRLTDTNINLASFIAEEENANLEEEIVKFKAEETAYQAALQVSNDIMNLNILRYLS